MKLCLTKSIEARRLNPRTLVPASGPEVTIPFGAIIEDVEADRDMDRFRYHGEPYRCPHDLLASATDEVKEAPAPAPAPPPAAAAVAAAPAAAASPGLRWEPVESTHYSLMRAKVPGGWLVAMNGASLAFYADPAHAWTGRSLE